MTDAEGATLPGGPYWADGCIRTDGRSILRVRTDLDRRDRTDSLKVRCGIGRMRRAVPPGIYAVGDPSGDSPVFVTANYKMSFDRLRTALAGRHGWILLLDTRGINVWCAAGGGLFGTEELVRRIRDARLEDIVSHRTLILPQLGAPGIAAHELKRLTGWRALYGPVRAEDLPGFLDAGMKASPQMRRVTFNIAERMAVAPVELLLAAKYALPAALLPAIAGALASEGASAASVMSAGAIFAALFLASVVSAVLGTAALLPWLPGRAFSLKGAWLGIVVAVPVALVGWSYAGVLAALGWILIVLAVTSFLALNFTGSTPYTSLSGVRKEMRLAVPLQVAATLAGMTLLFAGGLV